MGRLIDADVLKNIIESEKNDNDEMCRICIESTKEIIDAQPTAYDPDKVVEQLKNINTTWNCQECVHLNVCDEIQMKNGSGSEHIDLCAEVVKTLAIEIVKGGGVDGD